MSCSCVKVESLPQLLNDGLWNSGCTRIYEEDKHCHVSTKEGTNDSWASGKFKWRVTCRFYLWLWTTEADWRRRCTCYYPPPWVTVMNNSLAEVCRPNMPILPLRDQRDGDSLHWALWQGRRSSRQGRHQRGPQRRGRPRGHRADGQRDGSNEEGVWTDWEKRGRFHGASQAQQTCLTLVLQKWYMPQYKQIYNCSQSVNKQPGISSLLWNQPVMSSSKQDF